jgi:hypothetical protein
VKYSEDGSLRKGVACFVRAIGKRSCAKKEEKQMGYQTREITGQREKENTLKHGQGEER